MPSQRKFYRTIIQVEVLSEEPYEITDLEDIAYDVDQGDCSGITKIVSTETVGGPEITKLLEAQGSDPEFFQLTPEGEDIEEE